MGIKIKTLDGWKELALQSNNANLANFILEKDSWEKSNTSTSERDVYEHKCVIPGLSPQHQVVGLFSYTGKEVFNDNSLVCEANTLIIRAFKDKPDQTAYVTIIYSIPAQTNFTNKVHVFGGITTTQINNITEQITENLGLSIEGDYVDFTKVRPITGIAVLRDGQNIKITYQPLGAQTTRDEIIKLNENDYPETIINSNGVTTVVTWNGF